MRNSRPQQPLLADAEINPQVEPPAAPLVVIGIGAAGLATLNQQAIAALRCADIVYGSARQLGLLAADPACCTALQQQWPSPLLPHLATTIGDITDGKRRVVLASGDPLFYGIGTTLINRYGRDQVQIISNVSSFQLACAALGWSTATTPVVSVLTQPVSVLQPLLDQGQPVMVLCRNRDTVTDLRDLLCSRGTPEITVTVLSDLGSRTQRIVAACAADLVAPDSDLVIAAVHPASPIRSVLPGLDEQEYQHDGQITKRIARSVTVCALRPMPGDHLWDIGGGSGSVAIEFCRSTPKTTATIFESNLQRQATITANVEQLVGSRIELSGAAPDACEKTLAAAHNGTGRLPTKIFIGGGLTHPGVVDIALAALTPGGVLVANAVTLETQALLRELHANHGGELVGLQVSDYHPVGSFGTLRPQLPLQQWRYVKPAA
ncbi:precorrin-6y C5,15-methyltransferase (decarboxylating) subunit CbiE [Corynebacterium choanae]|uniref:Precorrin-6Y C(5,15)-methyltransferase [decarboxylating] n=1 Tax=Corynebacterium choanae TaxID=1862358 RepID=A0A3G6J634_9CORY|nr:precorrin-6y C5,15-methyltransferase (decarboxylating) subunit CbiE [Corynebacterium choanae]AZA13555.1 Precorrin-6Y C(5,15)-methyltransferase [decarboxylating] [Corynebacterium choanae]